MKRIIIIGATSGIGKELAVLYAEKGNRVGITGRRKDLLSALQNKYSKNIVTACFDATGKENKQHLHELIAALGGLDLFVYNAGGGKPSKTLDMETELATVRINALSCAELTGYAFQYFLKQGYGQIAITSSVAALRGNSWAPAYSASKAFVSNYAEGLNIKAKRMKKDIVITDIRPGFVDTRMDVESGRFWVATPQKAARQIKTAIAAKKRVTYITRRWWLVGQVMKFVPFWLYRRLA